MRSKKMIILGIIMIVLGLGVLGGTYYYNQSHPENGEEEVKQVALKDDFYENVNYEILKKAKIPNDSSSWSLGYDVTKEIEERTKTLTNEILADPNFKNEDAEIVLELVHDYEGRNKRGFSELKPYFDMVDNVKTIEDYNKLMLKVDEDLNLQLLIVGSAMNDITGDINKMIFAFDQVDQFEFFTESKFARYKDGTLKLIKKIATEIGYTEEQINKFISDYEAFAKRIQAKSIKQSEINDITTVFVKYSLDDITKEIKNIPIKRFLENRKIADQKEYVMADLGHYKALDEFYTEENLPFLKDVAKINIAAQFFPYSTEENEKFMLDLNNELSGTSQTLEKAREDEELEIKMTFIQDELEKRYEKKYFTDEDKKIVADLVEEVKKEYIEVIKRTEWLNEKTKEYAIKKVTNMKVKIGYQENDKKKDDYVKPISKANGGTIISNTIASNKYDFAKYSEQFHEEAKMDGMSTLEVNAFYNPYENSINFLAGFKGMYEKETNYYRMLAYFGTVIAHEISHGFDNVGSKYDDTGKFYDWWTQEDRENYDKITKKIEDYYSKYELMGFKVDGHKTVGENIADLAGVKTILSIMEKKGASKEDYKNFFEAYANLWAEKANKEAIENQILGDTHSPSKIRVNAVLSSMDKFYEIYDIKEGDGMYIAPQDRVGLW